MSEGGIGLKKTPDPLSSTAGALGILLVSVKLELKKAVGSIAPAVRNAIPFNASLRDIRLCISSSRVFFIN